MGKSYNANGRGKSMGITLKANKSAYSFDMGCGGFFNLRTNIADLFDEEFGEHYRKLSKCYNQIDYKEHDRIANEILLHPRFKEEDADILDFLYASDRERKISYKTRGKLYNLIKDHDFGKKCFRYAAYAHNDYEELKAFLKECYSHRRNAYWR